MKKFLLPLALLLAVSLGSRAQDSAQAAAAAAAAEFADAPIEEAPAVKPNYWKAGASFDFGLTQTALSNWAAGGYRNISMAAGLDANLNFTKDLASWTNRLQLQYGFFWSEDKINVLQKSNDRIYLESKFSYKTSKDSKFNYSAGYEFRSQFTDTWGAYSQGDDEKWVPSNLKSGFISPAYNNLSLGMEWQPVNWFDVSLSPLTGSLTICSNEVLRKAYGMPLNPDGETYSKYLFQFGAQVKSNFKMSINDVFKYETQFTIFTNYLHKPFQEYRVLWDNKITWQIAKFFTIGFSTWLIYDPVVEIDGVMSKVQFKDFLAFNLSYTLGSK